MARYINIYFGFTPNLENNTYYAFNDKSKYLTLLNTKTFIRVDLDNYRINTGIIRIKKDAISANNNILNASYVVEIEDGNIKRCWHVINIDELDYYVLNVKIDLWGTYISVASLEEIHITRCNRAINPKGLYDDVVETYERSEEVVPINPQPNGLWADTDLYIVYLVEYNVEQSAIFGDQHISKTQLFATPFSQFNYKEHTTWPHRNMIINAIDAVGGITKIANNMDARVLQAWLIPTRLINIGVDTGGIEPTQYYAFHSRGQGGEYDFNGYVLYPSHKQIDLFNMPDERQTFELNYQNYVGPRNNGYKVLRYVDKTLTNIKVHAFIGTNNLQVVIMQGDNEKDITKDLEATLTTNNGEVTGIRAVASVIGKTLTSTLGFFASKKAFGTWAGASAFAKASAHEITTDKAISSMVGSGDATNLYYYPINDNSPLTDFYILKCPFILEKFRSTRDEEMHARMEGAKFDEYVTSLAVLDNYNLLGTGEHLTLTDTYIVGDLFVEGIPQEAKAYIELTFKTGFYMQYLH